MGAGSVIIHLPEFITDLFELIVIIASPFKRKISRKMTFDNQVFLALQQDQLFLF